MLGCRQAGGQGAGIAPIPLRVGQLWELGPQGLLAPALAHHPGTLTSPICDPTCSPSFRWGASHICGFWSPIPTLAHSHESLAHSPPPSWAIAHTCALVQPVFCTLSPPTPPLPIPHILPLFHTFHSLFLPHSRLSSVAQWSVGDSPVTSHSHFLAPCCGIVCCAHALPHEHPLI